MYVRRARAIRVGCLIEKRLKVNSGRYTLPESSDRLPAGEELIRDLKAFIGDGHMYERNRDAGESCIRTEHGG